MKVYFIQDNSFLRTTEKTNPFFDPIIKVCEKNGIEWKVWLPAKPAKCGYDKLHVGYYTAFLNIGVWFWRFVHLIWRQPVWKVYELYGKLARPFFGRQLKADLYITIAGNLAEQLAGLFPNARVIDIQHGVIYSRHSGYFDDDGRLASQYQIMPQREFWVYGKGYADCFFKHPENAKDLEGRVKIIGDVVRAGAQVESCKSKVESSVKDVEGSERNLVVISAQFKPDYTRECLLKQTVLLRKFLTEFYQLYGDKYTVLIKHHPRFAGIEELSALYKEFPNFKETKEPWPALYGKMVMHVTISSTVVFDVASNGIPSYLINPPPDEQLLENWFWRDDYNYPYYGKSIEEVMQVAENEEKRSGVRRWFEQFYASFDEDTCKKLLGII